MLSPYTHRSTNLTAVADPLNLVFTGRANVERVASIFVNELFPPWLDTVTLPNLHRCANTQWVYVDDGVEPKWQEMNYTLAIGGCTLNRVHIRLFDGGHNEQLGEFTLANVHYEHWDWLKDHVVEDWDKSESFVRQLFEGKPFYKQIEEAQLQVEGEELQNVYHDGQASIIELQ